jgi:hypothetical protein
MKAFIGPLVAGLLVMGGLDPAVAQTPAAGPSQDRRMEKSADKDDKTAMQTAVGRVKSVSSGSLVVMGKSKGQGAEWTFVLDAQTRIRKEGKDVTAADLKEGDGVQVRYMEHGGKHIAQTVRARAVPPRSEAKPDKPADKKP